MEPADVRGGKRAAGLDRSAPRLHFVRLWQGLGWIMVLVVIWLSLTPTPPRPPGPLSWDKANHFLAYGALMYWFAQAFIRHWRWPLFLAGLGLALELLQGWGGVRSFDLFDIIANVLGVALGLGLAHTSLGRGVGGIDRWLARSIGLPDC